WPRGSERSCLRSEVAALRLAREAGRQIVQPGHESLPVAHHLLLLLLQLGLDLPEEVVVERAGDQPVDRVDHPEGTVDRGLVHHVARCGDEERREPDRLRVPRLAHGFSTPHSPPPHASTYTTCRGAFGTKDGFAAGRPTAASHSTRTVGGRSSTAWSADSFEQRKR